MSSDQTASGQGAPFEQPAVRTTIVGGRPPGSGKPLGDIPRGIEVLVKKAAVDADFRELLLARRSAAADEIGLRLEPAEAAILDMVPAAQLAAIITSTRVEPTWRHAFMGKAAAVMLVALGASAVAASSNQSLAADKSNGAPAPAYQNPPIMKPAAIRVGGPIAIPLPTQPASQPAPTSTSSLASAPASAPAVIAADELDKLLKQMDSNDYKEREAAQNALADKGKDIVPTLKDLLKKGGLNAEVTSRLQSIIDQFEPPARPVNVGVTRGVRAVD